MTEPTSTPIKDGIHTASAIKTPPRVYYLSYAQGRMASYYNAMELPEQYTTNHSIPRTNHFIPVGYCCLGEIAPRPVSINYRGKNPRNDYRPPGNISTPPVQNVEAKVEEKPVLGEPGAPPSTPGKQTVKEVAPSVPEGVKPDQQVLSVATPVQSSAISAAPAITVGHAIHLPQPQQTAPAPAQPSCPSVTSTRHLPQSAIPPPTTHVNHVTASPLATRMLSICRRWLIGTCRRGASCRNRHYVLGETDAELMRIKESHLAIVRFYNESRAAEAATFEVGGTRLEPRKEGQFVEAHVEGLGKVEIPLDVLSSELQGLKLQNKAGPKSETAMPQTPTVLASPAVSATESTLEPLPDFTLSMPTVVPPPTQRLNPPSTIQRIRRAPPAIRPAERFRASYAPHHHPLSAHPYSRRAIQQQDFVPRHVLDRALQQYIAGSLRGRRFLGPRPPSARKRAVLAQMSAKDAEVGGKGVSAQGVLKEKEELVDVKLTAAAAAGKEEARKHEWSEEVSAEVEKETNVEKQAQNSVVVPALLVDIAPV